MLFGPFPWVKLQNRFLESPTWRTIPLFRFEKGKKRMYAFLIRMLTCTKLLIIPKRSFCSFLVSLRYFPLWMEPTEMENGFILLWIPKRWIFSWHFAKEWLWKRVKEETNSRIYWGGGALGQTKNQLLLRFCFLRNLTRRSGGWKGF